LSFFELAGRSSRFKYGFTESVIYFSLGDVLILLKPSKFFFLLVSYGSGFSNSSLKMFFSSL
jgi:hypothetical protein